LTRARTPSGDPGHRYTRDHEAAEKFAASMAAEYPTSPSPARRRIVREREPELAADGPLQYDAAAVASVGEAPRIAIAAGVIADASSIRKGSILAVLRLACHLYRSSAGIKVIWLASAY